MLAVIVISENWKPQHAGPRMPSQELLKNFRQLSWRNQKAAEGLQAMLWSHDDSCLGGSLNVPTFAMYYALSPSPFPNQLTELQASSSQGTRIGNSPRPFSCIWGSLPDCWREHTWLFFRDLERKPSSSQLLGLLFPWDLLKHAIPVSLLHFLCHEFLFPSPLGRGVINAAILTLSPEI